MVPIRENPWVWVFITIVCGIAMQKLIYIIQHKLFPSTEVQVPTEYETLLQITNKGVTVDATIENSEGSTVVLNQINVHPKDRAIIDEADIIQISTQLKNFWSSEGAWLLPLPWIEVNMLPIEDYFVELELEYLSRDGKHAKAQIKLEEMFEPIPGSELYPTRILASGQVGFGKTTLLIKLAHLWATTNTFLSRFRFLVLFRLRDLMDEGSLEAAILHIFEQQLVASKKESKKKLFTFLERNSQYILLLIDGYDECTKEQEELVHKVLSTSSATPFGLSTILVTSRPLTSTIVNKYFHKHVRILGLSEQNRVIFIERFFGTSPVLIQNIKQTLSTINPSFLAHISPFMLYLICFLHEKREEVVYTTHVELMDNVLILMGQRCCEKEDDLEELTEEEMWSHYFLLGKVFYYSLKSGNVNIEQKQLDQVFTGDQIFVKKCGLLRQPTTMYRKSSTLLEPAHKSFMEHLAAKWLQIVMEHKKTPEEKKEFITDLNLPIFELSILFQRGGVEIMVPVVSGVLLVWCLPNQPLPESKLTIGESNFITINDEKMHEYFENYYGKGDTLKLKYEIGPLVSKEPGDTDSLCPITIPLESKYEVLMKLAASSQLFHKLEIEKLPQCVWIEVKREEELGLAKYEDIKAPTESSLRLIEIDFAYNTMTWRRFYRRLVTICNVLLGNSNYLREDYVGLTAWAFLTDLLKALSRNRLNRSVIVEVHRRPDRFRYLCMYDATRQTFWYTYIDVKGMHLYGEVTEEELYEKNQQALENVTFMEYNERANSSSDSSYFKLVDRNDNTDMLFRSVLKLYDDSERCKTLLGNHWRSDFRLRYNLNELPLPVDKTIVLLFDIHNNLNGPQ